MSAPATRMSRRDAWLLAAIPAIFLGGIYVWFLARPAQDRLDALEVEIAAARKAARIPAEVAAIERRVRELTADIEKEKAIAKRPPAAPSPWCPPALAPATLQRVTSTFAEHGLTVLASDRSDSGRAAVPAAAGGLGSAPREWKFDLVGRFESLLGAVTALAESDDCVVPFDLAMKPAAEDGSTDARIWTLWVRF